MADIRHVLSLDPSDLLEAIRRAVGAFDHLGDEAAASEKKIEKASKDTTQALKKQEKATKDAKKSSSALGDTFLKIGAGAAGLVFTAEKMVQAFRLVADAVYEITETEPQIKRFSDAWSDTLGSVLDPLAATVVGIKGATAEMLEEFNRSEEFKRFSSNIRTALLEVGVPVIAAFGRSVDEVKKRLAVMAGAADVASTVIRVLGSALRGNFDAIDKAGGLSDQYSDALLRLDSATADLAGTLDGVDDSWSRWVEQIRAQATAAEAGITSTRRLKQEQKTYGAEVEEGAKQIVKAEKVKQDAIRETLRVREDAAEKESGIIGQLASMAISSAQDVAETIISGLKRLALANVKEAKKRRDVELGLAILRGELQAAGAFGTTLATYGGTPQGFALAAAAAAAVGIQSKVAAGVAFSASSDKFHSGGEVLSVGAGGEVPALLLPKEGVVNRQGMQTIGRSALDDINAGQQPSGGNGVSVGVLMVNHKAAGAITSQALDDAGSSLSRRLSAISPSIGGYNPHRGA